MNQDKGIMDELKAVSPLLHDMKEAGNQPFRVPEGYFKSLQKQVFSAIDSGLADGVGKGQKEAFRVPENYFENLTGDIMSAIEAEESSSTSKSKVIELQTSRRREPIPMRRWTAMAASVAIFITLGILAGRFLTLGGPETPEFAVSQDEAIEYLEENISTWNSEDLFALVDLEDEDLSLEFFDEMEDELHEYLEENIDDLEDYLLTVEI